MFWKIALVTLLVSCGAPDDSGSEAPADASSETIRPDQVSDKYAVATLAADLPECQAESEGLIYFIRDQKSFVFCAAGKWGPIDLKGATGEKGEAGASGTNGKDGSAGLEIVKADNLLGADLGDLCSRYVNIICLFGGGALIEYSNGVVSYEGKLVYSVDYSINDGNDIDSDIQNISSATVYCEPEAEYCTTYLRTIARTGSDDFKNLWIRYTPSSGVVDLVHDTNDDEKLSASDEVLGELTRESMFVVD